MSGNLNVFTLRNLEKTGDKLNFNNTVSFAGKEDRLILSPDFENLSALTVISVFKPEKVQGEVELWSIQANDSNFENSTSLTSQRFDNNGEFASYAGVPKDEAFIHIYTQRYRKNARTSRQVKL